MSSEPSFLVPRPKPAKRSEKDYGDENEEGGPPSPSSATSLSPSSFSVLPTAARPLQPEPVYRLGHSYSNWFILGFHVT